MQTTGIFETHIYTIKCRMNEPIHLIPVGDIHFGAPMHAEDLFLEFLDQCSKNMEKVIYLGMGDYQDIASASERGILGNQALHDSTKDTLDSMYIDMVSSFHDTISPIMGNKIIGLIEGNHYVELLSGMTSTMLLAQMLKTKYLGVSAFIRLVFELDSTTRTSIDIWAHHGKGAARRIGGSLNRVEQMVEGAEADIYLMGHDHRKSAGMISRLYMDRYGAIKERKLMVARTGSFLKAYQSGSISYIADIAGNPVDLGTIKIILTPRRDKKKNGRGLYIEHKVIF
jgi:UDP-2,3-diacylglucosamine pyrophosphatase LpxH